MTDAIQLPPDVPTPATSPDAAARIPLADAAAKLDRLVAQLVYTQPGVDIANPHGTEAHYYVVSRSTVSLAGVGDLGVPPMQLQYEQRRDASFEQRQTRGYDDASARSTFVDFAVTRRTVESPLGFIEAQIVDGPLFTNYETLADGRLQVQVGPDTRRLEIRMDLRHLPADPAIAAHVAHLFEEMALTVDATHVAVFSENGPECAALVNHQEYDLAPDGRRQFADQLTQPDVLNRAVKKAVEVAFGRELGEGGVNQHELDQRLKSAGQKLAHDLGALVTATTEVAPGTSARDRMAGPFTWTATGGVELRPGSPWSIDTVRQAFEVVPQKSFASIGAFVGGRTINLGDMLVAGCTAPLFSAAVDGSFGAMNEPPPELPHLRYDGPSRDVPTPKPPGAFSRLFPPSASRATVGIATFIALQNWGGGLVSDLAMTAAGVVGYGSLFSYLRKRGADDQGGHNGSGHDQQGNNMQWANTNFNNDDNPATNLGPYDTPDASPGGSGFSGGDSGSSSS